jgi:molybdopterin biosynthesis enzyme
MPGYPTSCLSNAYILLVPALRRMARLPLSAPRTQTMRLAAPVASVAGRHQFYTVRVVDTEAIPAFKASGDITSMSRADGYIEIPAEVTSLAAGTDVLVTLF